MNMLLKIVGGSIAVAAMLASTTPSAQAQNLLVNGSFENAGGFTANPIGISGVNQGWALFGQTAQSDMSASVDYPYSGSYALLEQNAVGNNWNPAGAYQIIDGIPNATYSLSAWYLTDTGSSSPIGPVDIQLQFLDASLANLATFETGWIGLGLSNDTWYQGSVTGTAPVGTVYASVYLMFMDNGQTFTENMYFDDAVLTVPEPSTLALAGVGLSFGLGLLRRRNS